MLMQFSYLCCCWFTYNKLYNDVCISVGFVLLFSCEIILGRYNLCYIAAHFSLFVPNRFVISFLIFGQSLYTYNLHFCSGAVGFLYPISFNRLIILYGLFQLACSLVSSLFWVVEQIQFIFMKALRVSQTIIPG